MRAFVYALARFCLGVEGIFFLSLLGMREFIFTALFRDSRFHKNEFLPITSENVFFTSQRFYVGRHCGVSTQGSSWPRRLAQAITSLVTTIKGSFIPE